jgi:pilus assembly protein FimV
MQPQPTAETAPQPTDEAPAPELADRALGPDVKSDVSISSETGWPQDEAAPTVEALAPAERTDATSASPEWATASEYLVRPGDTLWAIAERMRADQGLTLEQVMVAIFKNNKSAFFGNNLNNLRAGKILKLPEREAVEASAPLQARKEFRAQYDVWQEYKLKLAAQSGALKMADAAPGTVPVEEARPEAKPDAPTEAKTEAAAKQPAPADPAATRQPDELLKIVRSTLESEKPGADQAAGQGESAVEAAKREQAALAERVSTLEESLESKQLENRELTEKVGQVRAQLKNEKRLLELENQQLAQAQAQPQPAQESKPEAKPEPVAEAKSEPAAVPKTEAKPQPPAAAKPDAPKKRVAPPPPPPEEKGFLATLIDDLVNGGLLPVIGGVVVLAGGVILLVYMRRRQRSIAEFEESILASDAIAPDSSVTTGNTTGQAVTTGDTSFLSDFSQGSMGHVQTDDVDPIAEAEVYLAYGRDETAEEILKEAIVKNPNRQELKLKLLEIYHQRNDVAAFETLAEELYAALAGRGGKVWDKVEEMGRRLSPNNPMFQRGASATARRTTDQPAAAPLTAPAATSAAFAEAETEVAHRGESAPTIDFDFDAGSSAAPKPPEAEQPAFDVNFDLGEEAKTGTDDVGLDFAQAPSSGEQTGLDGLELGQPTEHVIDFEQAKAEPSGGGDISFELPGEEKAGAGDLSFDMATEDAGGDAGIRFEPTPAADDGEIQWGDATEAAAPAAGAPGNGADTAGEPQWDEIATKLDLARAYIDMGDGDGARSILEEVIAEGNEQQKKQAAELVSQIG